jgi:O-antigen/teichoic acid export membrane protein
VLGATRGTVSKTRDYDSEKNAGVLMKNLHGLLFYSALDKYVSISLAIAMAAITARLLTRDEIGVFAIASIVAVTSESLRDFGASIYIIQSSMLTRTKLRTAFTVTAAMSVVIALALIGVSGPIAGFYTDPRLAPAVLVAAAGMVAASFGAPSIALLRREMRFGVLALVNISGLLANLLSFLAFYALGWNYLSLVLAALVASLIATTFAVLVVHRFWMFVPCLKDWRDIVTFGGFASATAILNTLYFSLPQLLLGRLSGLDAVGIYNRATILCQLPDKLIVGAFQPVIYPAFAAQARAGGDLKVAYLHALSLLSAVQWPALLVIAVLAEPAVRIVFGPQWDACAPLLRIMAIASLVMAPSSLSYPLLVASGRIRDTMVSSLIVLPASAVVVLVAAPYGMETLAWSMFVTLPFQMAVALWFIRRQIDFAWTELLKSTWKSGVVAGFAAFSPVILVTLRGPSPDPSTAMLAAVFAGVALGWLMGLVVTGHQLLGELRIVMRIGTPFLRALLWSRRRTHANPAVAPSRRPVRTTQKGQPRTDQGSPHAAAAEFHGIYRPRRPGT